MRKTGIKIKKQKKHVKKFIEFIPYILISLHIFYLLFCLYALGKLLYSTCTEIQKHFYEKKKKKKNVSSVLEPMPDFRLNTKHHKNLFICNLRPFQDYFNYFELIQSVRWMKIEVLGESHRRVWCGSLIIRRNDEIWQTA